MSVLVTGAGGFVGQALCRRLSGTARLTAASRASTAELYPQSDWLPWSELLAGSQQADIALSRSEVVIHLVGCAHQRRSAVSSQSFQAINVDATLAIARRAAAQSVRRFVFLSSVKVNGEQTCPGQPFTEDDLPAPEDDYGRSKWQAEQGLWALAQESGMEVVVIRPVLVYGPGAKGNLDWLLRGLSQGLPLPLAGIDNRRSLIGLDNLLDLIDICRTHPAAANQTFLASDGVDLSTSEILYWLGQGLERPVRLWPMPGFLRLLAANLPGIGSIMRRLYGSLQVDPARAQHLLGWQPRQPVEQGLMQMARAFRP